MHRVHRFGDSHNLVTEIFCCRSPVNEATGSHLLTVDGITNLGLSPNQAHLYPDRATQCQRSVTVLVIFDAEGALFKI